MNLFIVPSWYPSVSNSSYGIFVKEQISMLVNQRPDWKVGVSTWGQGDHEKLIWIKDHVRNFSKFKKHGEDEAKVYEQQGFTEYYQPALSWTKKLRKGNLDEIIRCNELNYQAHTLRFGKPDVVLVQACYPGAFIANYLSKKYDVPVHLHIRLGGFMFENLLSEMGSMKQALLDAIKSTQSITCTSHFQQGDLKKWIPNTEVLYNPVDLDHFRINEEKENYAVAIGRLEEEKGFDLLLEALAQLPELNIKVVGSGSKLKQLSSLARSLAIEDRVEFIGERDRQQVLQSIQHAQFLILPSRYETFGNVLLEAMACGKPVVATKCGGPEEIVDPKVGYLSEVSSEDLTIKIRKMMDNLHSFEPENIRKLVQDKFSPAVWANNLEDILRDLVKR